MLSKEQPHFQWEIKLPFNRDPTQSYDWLEPVNEMRGYTLYENGYRPFFKTGSNQFSDRDDFEFASYHILAKIDNKTIGCIRLLPLSVNLECVTSEIVGQEIFTTAINSFTQEIDHLAEVSRWIVHPDYQETMVGYHLGYAVWSLANYLGYRFIANGGRKSNKLITQYGAVYLPNYAGPYYSEKYNDNIYIFYFDKNKLSEKALKAIEKVSSTLLLDHACFCRVHSSKVNPVYNT